MTSATMRLGAYALLLATACGPSAKEKPRQAALTQDGAICAANGMRVYHRAGGPGGEGCVCAWLTGTNGATGLSSLLAVDQNAQQVRVLAKSKGSGRDKWNDNWDAAGCGEP